MATPRGKAASPAPFSTPRAERRLTSNDVPDDDGDQAAAAQVDQATQLPVPVPWFKTGLRRRSTHGGFPAELMPVPDVENKPKPVLTVAQARRGKRLRALAVIGCIFGLFLQAYILSRYFDPFGTAPTAHLQQAAKYATKRQEAYRQYFAGKAGPAPDVGRVREYMNRQGAAWEEPGQIDLTPVADFEITDEMCEGAVMPALQILCQQRAARVAAADEAAQLQA